MYGIFFNGNISYFTSNLEDHLIIKNKAQLFHEPVSSILIVLFESFEISNLDHAEITTQYVLIGGKEYKALKQFEI